VRDRRQDAGLACDLGPGAGGGAMPQWMGALGSRLLAGVQRKAMNVYEKSTGTGRCIGGWRFSPWSLGTDDHGAGRRRVPQGGRWLPVKIGIVMRTYRKRERDEGRRSEAYYCGEMFVRQPARVDGEVAVGDYGCGR
jgi:hypothetical protein